MSMLTCLCLHVYTYMFIPICLYLHVYAYVSTPTCLCLQFTLEEILGLAAAVEACSEHPLASAVLHFAAAHLAAAPTSFDAELSAGLKQLEGSSESSPLVGSSPGKANRQRSPVATDWLQPAEDIQVEEGGLGCVCSMPVCMADCLMLCRGTLYTSPLRDAAVYPRPPKHTSWGRLFLFFLHIAWHLLHVGCLIVCMAAHSCFSANIEGFSHRISTGAS